jgi:hypothetical protein
MGDFGDTVPGLKAAFDEVNALVADRTADNWTRVEKTVNQDVTTLSLEDDDDLSFPIVNGGHYALLLELIVSGNDAGYSLFIASSGGTLDGIGSCQYADQIAAFTTAPIDIVSVGVDLDKLCFITIGFAFTSDANGFCSFQFGNAATIVGGISRTWKGSVLKYKRLDA